MSDFKDTAKAKCWKLKRRVDDIKIFANDGVEGLKITANRNDGSIRTHHNLLHFLPRMASWRCHFADYTYCTDLHIAQIVRIGRLGGI